MSANLKLAPDMTAVATPLGQTKPVRRSPRVLAAAAGYAAAWLAGLAVPVPSIDMRASDSVAAQALSGHGPVFAVRALLVHAIAAVALAVVTAALARRVASTGAGTNARLVRLAGFSAVGLSLVQAAIELAVAGGAGGAGTLLDTVNVLDGLKMLALAALVCGGAAAASRGLAPRWLAGLAAPLVPALVVSAVAYALLLAGPAVAAYIALPLLLVWVTGTGLALAKDARL